MGARFDRDGVVEGPGEGAGEFPVAGAGIDEDLSRGQVVDHSLQQPLRVPFLVGVVEKNLKGALVVLSLRVKHPNGFRLCHCRCPADGRCRSRQRCCMRKAIGSLLFSEIRQEHQDVAHRKHADQFSILCHAEMSDTRLSHQIAGI